MKNKLLVYSGLVVKKLPNTMFSVKFLDTNKVILCYLSGKMRIGFVKINIGDIVKIEVNCTNFSKGRIIGRLK